MTWADKLSEKRHSATNMFSDTKVIIECDLVLAVLEKNKEIKAKHAKAKREYSLSFAKFMTKIWYARAWRELVKECEKAKK